MGTKHNPMVVTAVLRLRERLSHQALLSLVAERSLSLPRMRARIVVPRLGSPYWLEPDRLRAEDFVSPFGTADDDRVLATRLAEVAALPLDPVRPPWHLWTIEEPAGTTVVARIHHAIADGVSLLSVLFAMSDEGAGTQPVFAHGKAPKPTAPLHLVRAPRTERPAPLDRPLGGHKRFAWSRAMPLAALRERAHLFHAHVNDVLLAAIAGELRAFLARRDALPRAPLMSLVPMALPHDGGAGNQFVSAFVPLPVHLEHPVARLLAARDAMRTARAHIGTGLGRILVAGTSLTSSLGGRLGGLLERTGVRIASRGVSLVASDLPGPPIELHLGGAAIDSILFASPVPGSVPIAISAFGYKGAVRVMVATDDAIVADPWELVSGIETWIADT